jgi:predicted NACHT family NTPase
LKKKLLPIFTTYVDLVDNFGGDIEKLISDRISEALMAELRDVRYLLLIDALDEKNIHIDKQLETLRSLATDVQEKTNIKAVVTSRYLKGLDRTGLFEESISGYEIRPLSLNRTIEFITRICTELNLAKRIIEDLKKSQLFRELPKSPIAAILLGKLLNENSNDVPSNMTELYSKYIELMLGRWDIDKGLQTQKEYQALDNIIMEIAKYMMENEIQIISIRDVRKIFRDYLDARNLSVDVETLFNKMKDRCEIITIDAEEKILMFKHRTFVEFFYAKLLIRNRNLNIDGRAFRLYWMNTFYFYFGIQKDCPNDINEVMSVLPESEGERWLRIINLSNFF